MRSPPTGSPLECVEAEKMRYLVSGTSAQSIHSSFFWGKNAGCILVIFAVTKIGYLVIAFFEGLPGRHGELPGKPLIKNVTELNKRYSTTSRDYL
jgi:hypothetical protein